MLTTRDRSILDFEEQHPRPGGRKDELIRQQFGFGAVRYYQILQSLLGRQDAEEAYPQLVHRLRRRAIAKAEERQARVA